MQIDPWTLLTMPRFWEAIAVVLAVMYLLLAVRQHLGCWYLAFFSSFIYTLLYWDVSLYMQSLLQVYYLFMAVFGWFSWKGFIGSGSGSRTLLVTRWSIKQHGLALVIILAATLISGYWLQQHSDDTLPYLDSLNTWAAVVTTYMVTRKVLDNWVYWLLINSVGIYLNLEKDLIMTALLLSSYQVIALFGWRRWYRDYLEQLA